MCQQLKFASAILKIYVGNLSIPIAGDADVEYLRFLPTVAVAFVHPSYQQRLNSTVFGTDFKKSI